MFGSNPDGSQWQYRDILAVNELSELNSPTENNRKLLHDSAYVSVVN